MRVILVSQFEPTPIGHGGNHRAYQIVRDLAEIACGLDPLVVTWPGYWAQHPPQPAPTPDRRQMSSVRLAALAVFCPCAALSRRHAAPLRHAARLAWQRLPYLTAADPVDLLDERSNIDHLYSSRSFAVDYERLVTSMDEPLVCVVEHVGFADVLATNEAHGIPTVACVENLESLDTAAEIVPQQKRSTYHIALELAEEVRILAKCQARVFISKVEAGLIGGLGLSATYYPYLPVGDIRARLLAIRSERAHGIIQRGLFLMVGSATHSTTEASFRWLTRQVQEFGLPPGIQVVVAGAGTERLLPPGVCVPGLELRGWVDQPELDALLLRAQAVLIPQLLGFGALTKVPELSYAGVPMIVSRHAVYAVDLPPGVSVVNDDWGEWVQAMSSIAVNSAVVPQLEYDAWEQTQPRPLRDAICGAEAAAGRMKHALSKSS